MINSPFGKWYTSEHVILSLNQVSTILLFRIRWKFHLGLPPFRAVFTSSILVVTISTKLQYGRLFLLGSGRLFLPMTINRSKGCFSMFTSYNYKKNKIKQSMPTSYPLVITEINIMKYNLAIFVAWLFPISTKQSKLLMFPLL